MTTVTAVTTVSRGSIGLPFRSERCAELPSALLAHRSDLMLRGMAFVVEPLAEIKIVHTQLPTLLADLVRLTPTLLIVEDRLAGRADVTATGQIAQIRAAAPATRQIVIGTLYDGVYVGHLLSAGVQAYLCTADSLASSLPEAILAVLSGRGYLSPSAAADYVAVREKRQHGRGHALAPDERQALALLVEGCDVADTMRCLKISRDRVYRLHQRLRLHYGVATNEALIQRVLMTGLPLDTAE